MNAVSIENTADEREQTLETSHRDRRPVSVLITRDATAAARARVRRLRAVLGISPSLLGLTLMVGVLGGALGAAYLLALHLLQHVLWPSHWHGATGFAVLGGVGVAVAVLTRFLGSPGDVELLVDNIHVSGGPSSVRTLRSLVPASLLTIAAGGGAGPEAPLVTTTGTLAAWLARTRRAAVAETRILTSPAWPPRSRCYSARRSARRCSHSRSCTAAACSTTRRWCPRSSARCRATAST
jgi:hypothetical protein